MANEDAAFFIEQDPFDPAMAAAYEEKLAEELADAPTDAKSLIEVRKRAYHNVFNTGKVTQSDLYIVLTDLMWFCKTWLPSYDVRDGIHAEELSKRKDGRREVFQRIKNFSCLDSDALLLMYTDATTK